MNTSSRSRTKYLRSASQVIFSTNQQLNQQLCTRFCKINPLQNNHVSSNTGRKLYAKGDNAGKQHILIFPIVYTQV